MKTFKEYIYITEAPAIDNTIEGPAIDNRRMIDDTLAEIKNGKNIPTGGKYTVKIKRDGDELLGVLFVDDEPLYRARFTYLSNIKGLQIANADRFKDRVRGIDIGNLYRDISLYERRSIITDSIHSKGAYNRWLSILNSNKIKNAFIYNNKTKKTSNIKAADIVKNKEDYWGDGKEIISIGVWFI